MTRAAAHRGGDMRGVVEVDEARLVMDPFPGDRLLAFPIAPQLLNLGAVRGNILVAAHALLNAGNAGDRAFRHTHMAELALDAVLGVNLVVEGNRLLVGGAGLGYDEDQQDDDNRRPAQHRPAEQQALFWR